MSNTFLTSRSVDTIFREKEKTTRAIAICYSSHSSDRRTLSDVDAFWRWWCRTGQATIGDGVYSYSSRWCSRKKWIWRRKGTQQSIGRSINVQIKYFFASVLHFMPYLFPHSLCVMDKLGPINFNNYQACDYVSHPSIGDSAELGHWYFVGALTTHE